uniref:Reverse transcriptase domain-containing protein n=1 Tax=Nicotiana tabacum TaxID=4097 RepID=A0A1S3ZF78_TOBAC|nr:PREDICTED: uncharacterized protein LOC107786200 [Nicotiana tabacum]
MKIEDNDKKVETCNSRVDQIPGAPPILKGLDSKKFVQKPFPQSAAPKPISKKFRMPDISKYNRTIDPNEHITAYTCGIKGNDLEDDEIESVLLKNLGKLYLKAHAGAIKVSTRKFDVFKIKQRENEMLMEFVSRFQSEPMELPLVSDDWAGSRLNKERYQPYVEDQRNISRRNLPQNDRRANRGQSSRGLMSKTGFVRHLGPAEAPRLSEYNVSIDSSGIVSAIGKIRDTRWLKPIQTDASQRNPNLVCKYHGTHGHRTKDCRRLREEVARLFNEGHLHEFLNDQAKSDFRERDANMKNEPEEPQHVIHIIIGGVDVP